MFWHRPAFASCSWTLRLRVFEPNVIRHYRRLFQLPLAEGSSDSSAFLERRRMCKGAALLRDFAAKRS